MESHRLEHHRWELVELLAVDIVGGAASKSLGSHTATQPSPPPANGLRHSGHQNTGTKTARLGPQRSPTDSDVAMCGNQNIFMD